VEYSVAPSDFSTMQGGSSSPLSQVGRDMTLHQIVDESVLGGIRVEVGDEVIEGTMASRLEEARRLFR